MSDYENSFYEQCFQGFRKKYPNLKVSREGGIIKIREKDGMKCELNMHTGYELHIKNGCPFEEILKSRIDAFEENRKIGKITNNFGKAKKYFIPVPRSPKNFTPLADVHKHFVADIHTYIGIDLESGIAYVNSSNIKNWKRKVSFEELFEIALKNLEKIEMKSRTEMLKGKEGTVIISGNSNLCSIIYLPEKFRQVLDTHFKGKKVVCIVPEREAIICKEANTENFVELANLGASMVFDRVPTYPVSHQPLLVDEKGEVSKYQDDVIKQPYVMAFQSKKNGEVLI